MSKFTVMTHGSKCKVIKISASDFIKSFKNGVETIKAIHKAKEAQYEARVLTIQQTHKDNKHVNKADEVDT